MIVESNGEFEVLVADVPIVIAVVHTGAGFVCICMVCCHKFLSDTDPVDGSTYPSVHVATCDSSSSSVKGFSMEFAGYVCPCSTLVIILSQFFFLLLLLEV
jgi:hypothetical protein